VTRLIYDRRLTYPVPHGFVTTRARVFRLQTGLDVLVATELEDDENPGPSITNTIESLAPRPLRHLAWIPARVTVYQHYDYRASAYQPNGEGETFDEVIFEWRNQRATRPQWHARSHASLVVLLALEELRYDYDEPTSPSILTNEDAIVTDVRFRRIRLASMHTVLEFVQSAMFLDVRGRVSATKRSRSILVWRIQ